MKTKSHRFDNRVWVDLASSVTRVARAGLTPKCFTFLLGLFLVSATALGDVVGYFKFDNFPGDNSYFTDDTGKGLRGLLGYPFSLPVSVPGPSGQAGDRAVAFDGRGGLVVDDSAAQVLNIIQPPITLECWVRATNFQAVHVGLVSYGVPGGRPADRGPGGYKLGIDPSGNILFTLFAVVDVFSGVPYPFDGEWHHVAAVYDGTDVVYYLDGQELDRIPEARAIRAPGTNKQLDIGAQYTGLGRFEGAIDRARVSKAALTVAQLDSASATVKPVQADTAVFFNFDAPNPPHQGQGLAPAGVAVPTAEWVIAHPPHQSDGDPTKATDTPSGVVGDRSLQFSGIDMTAVSDPEGVLNVTNDWTLEAWVKFAANLDGERDVLFYYGHPGHGYSLSIDYAADNKLQVTTLGIEDMASTTATLAVDVWQHVAVVHRKGASITYFVNGVEAGTRAYTGGTHGAETNKVLYIGSEWNGALPFTGWIDRVRISNSALAASELDSNPTTPAVIPASLRLAVSKSQSDVTLSWPDAGSTGYILEFSNVLPATAWSAETTQPTVAAGQKSVTVPRTEVTRFYRLRRP